MKPPRHTAEGPFAGGRNAAMHVCMEKFVGVGTGRDMQRNEEKLQKNM